MGIVELSEEYRVSVGDVELLMYDCTDHLDSDESLTGAPTIVESGSTNLTISEVAITTATETIKGRSVTAGKAVRALVEGFVSGTTHRLTITVDTDGEPARRFIRQAAIICV